MNTKILLAIIPAILVITSATTVFAQVTSPPGCNADNSVVNIARSTASAQVGQIITFTVSAGNPTSVDGCDIVGRTLTLTLPNGTSFAFGPFDYPNPTAVSVVGSKSYLTKTADLSGGTWTATVSWTGTLQDGFDNPSTGSKGVSVNYIPVNLVVTKTATPALEETYEWTIDKSVTPDTWDLFNGESGTSEFTVSVVKTLSGTIPSVSGTITVHNPALVSAHITGVTDLISGVGAATVDCPVSFPYDLAAGSDLTCTYSADLPNTDPRTNTATAATTGDVGSDSGDAAIDFTNVVPTIVGGSINVDDTNGGSWAFDDSGSVTYLKTFTCGEDEGTNDNTATIRGTDISASASVTVNCYELSVTKDATTSFDRKYIWDIEKTGSTSSLTLDPDATADVDYSITVDVVDTVDSNWAVDGSITVHNPAPIDAVLNSVSDVVSGPLSASVDCGVTFPYTLVAGGDLVCTYNTDLPNADARTNTATATQQLYDYDKDLVATADGTTDNTGQKAVTFGDTPNIEVDACIDVSDTYAGDLGTVCVGVDQLPKTFTYTRTVGPYTVDECGTPKVVDNTASFVTADTDTTGEASWEVTIDVPCPELGCTLTPGYWKTHSQYGPAPFDDTWNLLQPDGADSTFFLSGKSWYEVMWIAPKGNAYYQLSFQYTAAVLNTLTGATVPTDVQNALDDAKSLLETYAPSQVGLKTFDKAIRAEFISDAGILGSYNSGLIGPGHCDDLEALPS